jgi:general secretion pathway protein F
MNTFQVRAVRQSGELATFDLIADSKAAAVEVAKQRGLAVLSIRRGGTVLKFWKKKHSRFPLGLFSQELLMLIEAGLTVVEAIETLQEKEPSAERKRLFGKIVELLFQGRSFSHALELAGPTFPPLYVATVRASEKSGDLPESLRRLIGYQAQLDVVKKKIVSAAIYPALLAGTGTLVVLFLLTYVIPRFAKIFEDLGGRVPAMSRMLIQWGHLVHDHGTALLLISAGSALALIYVFVQPHTRNWLVGRLSHLPAFGEKLRIYQLARFYRTLGMLLRSGMPVMAALAMTQDLLQVNLRQHLAVATERIRQGAPISVAMDGSMLTTPVALRMLRVGEQTGQMGEMMERIAHFYDDEISRWIDWFIRLFEPLLMVFIGLVIGAIVVMMYFPIFELAGSLQ